MYTFCDDSVPQYNLIASPSHAEVVDLDAGACCGTAASEEKAEDQAGRLGAALTDCKVVLMK